MSTSRSTSKPNNSETFQLDTGIMRWSSDQINQVALEENLEESTDESALQSSRRPRKTSDSSKSSRSSKSSKNRLSGQSRFSSKIESRSTSTERRQRAIPTPVHVDYELELGGSRGFVLRQPSLARSVYVGVMTMEQAQTKLKSPCSFALYHPVVQPSQLHFSVGMDLHIVYRVSDGSFRHYAIERTQFDGSSYFRVACGNQPRFASLDSLVRFYRTYVSMSEEHADRCNVEVFPPGYGTRAQSD